MEALNKVWESASQEIYAAQASAEAAGGATGQEAPEEEGKAEPDVSDVEYEEVDDKK
jgi:molecular chaperone DnaK